MLALLAMLLSNTNLSENRDWREYDRRPMGWADSAFLYDAASIRRTRGLVSVWITYKFYYSGLPDPIYLERVAIDCPGRRSRIVESFQAFARKKPVRLLADRKFQAIEAGSPNAALADRICREGS